MHQLALRINFDRSRKLKTIYIGNTFTTLLMLKSSFGITIICLLFSQISNAFGKWNRTSTLHYYRFSIEGYPNLLHNASFCRSKNVAREFNRYTAEIALIVDQSQGRTVHLWMSTNARTWSGESLGDLARHYAQAT